MSETVVPVAPVTELPKPTLKQQVLDWLKQASTQQGFSLVVGGGLLAVFHPFANSEALAAVIVGAGIPKLWPDNTTDTIKQADVTIKQRQLALQLTHAAVTKSPTDIEAAVVAAVSLEAAQK